MVPEERRSCDAVYLHYLDRELNLAAGRRVRAEQAIRVTRLLVILTQSELYCGLSAIWENDILGPSSFDEIQLLFESGQLQTVSRDITSAEFLESRRAAYAFDQERYPRYFTNASEDFGWLTPTWQKGRGSTAPLEDHLRTWAEGPIPRGEYVPSALAVKAPVRDALNQREGEAITYSFFLPTLGGLHNVSHARYAVRRQISTGFTVDYLKHGSGTIATGIPELRAFDELSMDFPAHDTRLLGELGRAVGFRGIVDHLVTDAPSWARYVYVRSSNSAQILAAVVRWILDALYSRESTRAPHYSDNVEGFRDQHSVRTRMTSAIRAAGRVAEPLAPPPHGSDPEESMVRASDRLLWLADRLAERDLATKAFLDSTRGLIKMPTVDLVLVTVNDVETEQLTKTLDGAGYRARFEAGRVNTYWIYGPIGGTVVAHVRCGMGSSGQGGSTLTTIDAIRELHPAAVLGVGVAFGIDESKQPIGRLLLSERLTEYEKSRVGTDELGHMLTLSRGPSTEASPRLLSRFRDARLGGIGIEPEAGEMLSGEKLVDNPQFKAALLDRFPEAIGGEMEGAGVQAASGREQTEWLVVKAVCDYAREKGADKTRRQLLAASCAARAVLHVLEQGGLKGKAPF